MTAGLFVPSLSKGIKKQMDVTEKICLLTRNYVCKDGLQNSNQHKKDGKLNVSAISKLIHFQTIFSKNANHVACLIDIHRCFTISTRNFNFDDLMVSKDINFNSDVFLHAIFEYKPNSTTLFAFTLETFSKFSSQKPLSTL